MHSSSVFWYWGRLLLMPIGCLHSGFSLYFLSSAFSFWEMKYGPAQTLIIMRTTRRPTMRIGDMFFYSIQRKKKFTTEVGRGVRVDRFKETKNKIMNDLLKCTTVVELENFAGSLQPVMHAYDIDDHKVPIQFGGNNDECNLQALCTECHRNKTDFERTLISCIILETHKSNCDLCLINHVAGTECQNFLQVRFLGLGKFRFMHWIHKTHTTPHPRSYDYLPTVIFYDYWICPVLSVVVLILFLCLILVRVFNPCTWV